MKQYGEQTETFKTGAMSMSLHTHKRCETIWGGSYSRIFRDGRRSINKDPMAWWRKQTASAKDGCPHHYHCWGW